MGDPKRHRKKYETPRNPWEEDVLKEELRLIGSYGLRNKRELWRHQTELTRYRNIARSLLSMPEEKRAKLESELLQKLHRLGLIGKEATVEDALDLKVEDLLERRLQTIVAKIGLSKTIHQARQLISHGHIFLNGKRITSPSYLVLKDQESNISYSPDSPLIIGDHPLRRVST